MPWSDSYLTKNQLALEFTYLPLNACFAVQIAAVPSSEKERDSMSEDDEKMIRYHLRSDFVLDPGERILIESLEADTTRWVYQFNAPNDVRTSHLLQNYLRKIAREKRGWEAWRAVTERGEVLERFSVYDLAKELSGKQAITLHRDDQELLANAAEDFGLPPLR